MSPSLARGRDELRVMELQIKLEQVTLGLNSLLDEFIAERDQAEPGPHKAKLRGAGNLIEYAARLLAQAQKRLKQSP